jgi:hypothetical protein
MVCEWSPVYAGANRPAGQDNNRGYVVMAVARA